MPKKAERFHKRVELETATRAECRARWCERWGFDWSEDVARAWYPGTPTERELQARTLARELADALSAAMVFCESRQPGASPPTHHPGTPPSATEDVLAECLHALNPEPGLPEWAKGRDDLDYSPEDVSMIERLRKYAQPRFTDSPERANVVEMSHRWRLNLNLPVGHLPTLRCPLNDPTYDPEKDETAKAIFGLMESCEIAWASILLGNFPDITARNLRYGVSVAEAIEKETHAIRQVRRREDADLKARLAEHHKLFAKDE